MRLLVLALLLSAGVARAEPWRFAVAPSVGLTVPTSDLNPTVVGGLEVDYALPVLDRKLVLAVDAAISQPSHSGAGEDPRTGPYTYSIDATELKLSLDVIYRLRGAAERLVQYLGVGGVLHLLQATETTSTAPGENTEQSTEAGFELVGGVDVRLGAGLLLVEARLVYTGLDHTLTGETNAGNVMIGVGYRFTF
jgi:opacity protein-like surface antigen